MQPMAQTSFTDGSGATPDVRRRLDHTEPLDDAARLALLEELYGELERQLDRDFGEAPSPRR
jgi:hypothetical protein